MLLCAKFGAVEQSRAEQMQKDKWATLYTRPYVERFEAKSRIHSLNRHRIDVDNCSRIQQVHPSLACAHWRDVTRHKPVERLICLASISDLGKIFKLSTQHVNDPSSRQLGRKNWKRFSATHAVRTHLSVHKNGTHLMHACKQYHRGEQSTKLKIISGILASPNKLQT